MNPAPPVTSARTLLLRAGQSRTIPRAVTSGVARRVPRVEAEPGVRHERLAVDTGVVRVDHDAVGARDHRGGRWQRGDLSRTQP